MKGNCKLLIENCKLQIEEGSGAVNNFGLKIFRFGATNVLRDIMSLGPSNGSEI